MSVTFDYLFGLFSTHSLIVRFEKKSLIFLHLFITLGKKNAGTAYELHFVETFSPNCVQNEKFLKI